MPGISRTFLLASALLLLPCIVHAEDPYADFRVPQHRSFSWFVQAQGSANSFQRDTDPAVSREGSASGRLLTEMLWTSESEARQSDLGCELQASWNQARTRFESSSPPSEGSSHRRFDGQSLIVGADHMAYLGDSRFSIGMDAKTRIDFDQSRDSQAEHFTSGTFEQFSGSELQTQLYRQFGNASLGIGYGRVRDVTGVFDAQLIEQRLRATGRLTRTLSSAALLRLAQLHDVSGGFFSAHDRAARYFWREAERILRDDGALTDSTLDAYSLVRLFEPAFARQGFRRTRGGLIRPYLFGSETRGHQDRDWRNSRLDLDNGTPVLDSKSEFSERGRLNRKDAGVGISAEYHRPVGMRWQSDVFAGTSYGGGSRRELGVNSSGQVRYMIADRWFAGAMLRHSFSSLRLNGVRTEPEWSLDGRTDLSYLVEDSWSLDLTYTLSQLQSRNRERFFSPFFERSSGLAFGLTYRPAGRFDAPGLGI